MIKTTGTLLLVLALFSFSGSNREKHFFTSEKVRCAYETREGRIDGDYISYYANGRKKAAGTFENDYRTGTWTVWDSTGRMRMQRDYADPFTFKILYPEPATDQTIRLLNAPVYTIRKNADGFIEYSPLKERAVHWSKRIWRLATADNNPELFAGNRLFNVLHKHVLAGNIHAYGVADDQFRKVQLPLVDSANRMVIGYRIKEDAFFDTDRMVSEKRIIGICPVAVHKLKKDTTDLYWIYLPEARKYLAAETVKQKTLPAYVKTLDDIFFYRCFAATIYKESSIYDRTIAAYAHTKEEQAAEAERIEMEIIDTEHIIWIGFTK